MAPMESHLKTAICSQCEHTLRPSPITKWNSRDPQTFVLKNGLISLLGTPNFCLLFYKFCTMFFLLTTVLRYPKSKPDCNTQTKGNFHDIRDLYDCFKITSRSFLDAFSTFKVLHAWRFKNKIGSQTINASSPVRTLSHHLLFNRHHIQFFDDWIDERAFFFH